MPDGLYLSAIKLYQPKKCGASLPVKNLGFFHCLVSTYQAYF